MLEAEQLPARVPDLRARLAHVDEDSLTHGAWLSVTSRKLEERRASRFLHRGPRSKKLSRKVKSSHDAGGPPKGNRLGGHESYCACREELGTSPEYDLTPIHVCVGTAYRKITR